MYREEFANSVEAYRTSRHRFANRWIAIFCLVILVFMVLFAHFKNTDTFPGWDFYLGMSSPVLAMILLFPMFTRWWDRREGRLRGFSCSDCGESWDDKALSRILATGICRHCECSIVWDGEDDALEAQDNERMAVDEFQSRLKTFRKKARKLLYINIVMVILGSTLGGCLVGLLSRIDVLDAAETPAWLDFAASAVIPSLVLGAVSVYQSKGHRRMLDTLGLRCTICGDAFTGKNEVFDESVSTAVLETGDCPGCGIDVLHVEPDLD
jgi:hypothetical protein